MMKASKPVTKSVINPDNSWRTMLRARIGKIKVRFYWEPRDIWIGLFWDTRGFDIIFWICLIPCFPLQFVWSTKEELHCQCGFRHGAEQPEWCKRLLRSEHLVEALRGYIDNPLIQQRVLHEYFKHNPPQKNK